MTLSFSTRQVRKRQQRFTTFKNEIIETTCNVGVLLGVALHIYLGHDHKMVMKIYSPEWHWLRCSGRND